MTNEQMDIIEQLTQKIDTLINLHDDLRKENETLTMTNQQLKEIISQQNRHIEELEQKNEGLKMAKPEGTSAVAETHDTKIKINRMVREIDRCIALLNK